MPRLTSLLLILLLSMASLAPAEEQQATLADILPLSRELVAEGWISLVNRDLFGSEPTEGSEWAWRDGQWVCTSRGEGLPSAWLWTTTEWSDFELVVEYIAPEGDFNSGIFIRSPLDPQDPAKDCYEINLTGGEHAFPTGSIVGRARGEDYHPIGKTEQLRIVAVGPRVKVYQGDRLLTDYTDPEPILQGRIGLQYRQGNIAFTQVRLRPLGGKQLFNGKNLDGWNDTLKGPAEFSVTDQGELHVKNGPGQIESREAFGDFVLQYDCYVNGDGLNSGVFFRSIPGDRMNGYECQIQNAFKDGDRAKPADFGTGAIYRRMPARLVAADDHQWFTTTLYAHGPHIAVWVNGLQVTDWTDPRPPHENPRNGLRLAPGTFCLQAHDPTTDLKFRNFRVVELPAE